MTVSQSSSSDPTGLSSLMAPRISRGPGAGVLILVPHENQFKYMVHLDFKATNNMVEYEAPRLWFLMEYWKDSCGNLQLG
jgi:hypothetical protein